jgi:hypothetical protein
VKLAATFASGNVSVGAGGFEIVKSLYDSGSVTRCPERPLTDLVDAGPDRTTNVNVIEPKPMMAA